MSKVEGKVWKYNYVLHSNPPDISDLEDLLFQGGEFQIRSTSELQKFSQDQILIFGHRNAMYTIPTLELIEALKDLIGDSTAVEIGSGCGVIGKALGIKCTDNFCHDLPAVREQYEMFKQVTVKYGRHVEKRDAEWVAKKWRPDIILGSWITHKWCPQINHGNAYGPDEEVILDNCKKYIMLGNHATHAEKPIMKYRPDVIEDFPGYITKSNSPELNRVYIWEGRKK